MNKESVAPVIKRTLFSNLSKAIMNIF
jgi:hypothetical protein